MTARRASTTLSDLRQALDLFLRKPEAEPLQAVVSSSEIEGKVAQFDQLDATAIKKQRAYRRLGRFALWTMMVGAIVGALMLLPIEQWIDGRPRKLIEGFHALALILTFVAILWIGWRQSVGQWMQARAEAEKIRAEVFRAIVAVGADRKELLAPALACFKDAHLDWQLGFYQRRGGQHRSAAGLATPYRIAGYLLLALSVCLGAIGLMNLAEELGVSLWPSVKTAAQGLLPTNHGRWQLGLGAIASSILVFASARTFMDQNDRNAACYALAAEKLQHLKSAELPKAERAAQSGSYSDVRAFCEDVQRILDAEHLAWLFTPPLVDVNVVPKANR